MFNLGFSELIVLGAVALIFIGPKQLPEVAKTLGRLLNEWKRATSDITSSFTDNEAFREWDERRQKYLDELKIENPDSHHAPQEQLELPISEDKEKESQS